MKSKLFFSADIGTKLWFVIPGIEFISMSSISLLLLIFNYSEIESLYFNLFDIQNILVNKLNSFSKLGNVKVVFSSIYFA